MLELLNFRPHYPIQEEYCYFGIIGSMKRRNMLFDELLQYNQDLDFDKLDLVKTPAGLDIGSK